MREFHAWLDAGASRWRLASGPPGITRLIHGKGRAVVGAPTPHDAARLVTPPNFAPDGRDPPTETLVGIAVGR
jgi:hypothetical protein